LEDLGVDGRIILKLILIGIWGEGGMDGIALAEGRPSGGFCECGNEASGSIKIG
jgi:hypothetical protein